MDMLKSAMAEMAGDIDRAFDQLLAVPNDHRARLFQAMRHAAIGGGKRLRPLLVRATSRLFNVAENAALQAGLAVECVHVYSLIHDDLPAMDNDDLRHGKPTVHRAFDDATAILAGDAFQAMAFDLLADGDAIPDPFVRAELTGALAKAAGTGGMVGGQMLDIAAETATFDLPAVTRLQQLKTGALFGFCLEAGGILGHIPPEGRNGLRGYARDIGLAFQIADDLIDAHGDAAIAGKAVGKDAEAGKATFLSLLGPERARTQAELLVAQAIDHLAPYGGEADLLRQIARYVIERDR